MKEMIAYCGLRCDTCPVHLATLETDKSVQKSMRKSIAELCSQQFGMNLLPEDINDCDGCRSGTGKLFFGCRTCEVRKCASRKNIQNCGYCVDYPCDKLNDVFCQDPGAKTRLDEINLLVKTGI